MFRVLFILLILAFASSGCSAVGADTPESLWENYLASVKNKDMKAFEACHVPGFWSFVALEAQDVFDQQTARELVGIQTEGDRAVVTWRFPEHSFKPSMTFLVKERGWQITGHAMEDKRLATCWLEGKLPRGCLVTDLPEEPELKAIGEKLEQIWRERPENPLDAIQKVLPIDQDGWAAQNFEHNVLELEKFWFKSGHTRLAPDRGVIRFGCQREGKRPYEIFLYTVREEHGWRYMGMGPNPVWLESIPESVWVDLGVPSDEPDPLSRKVDVQVMVNVTPGSPGEATVKCHKAFLNAESPDELKSHLTAELLEWFKKKVAEGPDEWARWKRQPESISINGESISTSGDSARAKINCSGTYDGKAWSGTYELTKKGDGPWLVDDLGFEF